MIGTESRLWQVMEHAVSQCYKDACFTRVESPITPGCSDVEYTRMGPWKGWIELKTANVPRARRGVRLHSPFTFAQAAWLLTHQNEKTWQRSWLLIGLIGPRTWRSFVLVDPVQALKLLSVRKSEAHEEFFARKGVHMLKSMKEVLLRIRSET